MKRTQLLLVLTSLSFLFPLRESLGLEKKTQRKLYTGLMAGMTTSSVLVHSGVDKILWLDKSFIYLWIVLNAHSVCVIRRRKKALLFAFLVLLLGGTRIYQKHFLQHASMHIAGTLGTLETMKELKKNIEK